MSKLYLLLSEYLFINYLFVAINKDYSVGWNIFSEFEQIELFEQVHVSLVSNMKVFSFSAGWGADAADKDELDAGGDRQHDYYDGGHDEPESELAVSK